MGAGLGTAGSGLVGTVLSGAIVTLSPGGNETVGLTGGKITFTMTTVAIMRTTANRKRPLCIYSLIRPHGTGS
jgi:hypothetical protein